MCLSIPKKIISINKNTATIEGGDKVDITMVNDCQVGDFVIVNGPVAISKVDKQEANEVRKLIKENL